MNAHTPISEDLSETARFVNLDRRLNPPSKPSLRFYYPLIPAHTASRPIRDA